MIKHPGAYLIANCKAQDCPFRNMQIYFSLGLGKFDIAYIQNNAMCGGCGQMVNSMNDIAFYSCFWQFKGVTINNEQMESLGQQTGNEFAKFPHSDISWRWLTIQAFSGASNETANSKEASTQANCTAEESGQLIIDTLTEEAERYRMKYKETKNKLQILRDTIQANK